MRNYVYHRFGSKKGLVRAAFHTLLGAIGAYGKFSRIPPNRFQRLVFICSGNICRSPLAEAYARSLGREAASCGLDCGDGYPADPRAKRIAEDSGLAMDDHTTTNVENFEFHTTDLIVVMEPAHISSLYKKIGRGHQVVLAGSYCKRPTFYIHDPFNCCPEFFAYCEKKVMESVEELCMEPRHAISSTS